jgi:hypothetical protein
VKKESKVALHSFSSCMLFLILFFIVGAGVARAEGSGNDIVKGELHCYLGIVGLELVVLTLGVGLFTAGRFSQIKKIKTKTLHLSFSMLTSIFFTGEFIFGLLKAQWIFNLSFHSVFGFSAMTLSWLAVAVSPCFAGKIVNWKVSSKIHTVLAFLLLIFVSAQVINGYLFLE